MVKLNISILLLAGLLNACNTDSPAQASGSKPRSYVAVPPQSPLPKASSKGVALAQAAESIVDQSIIYDPQYFTIDYPNGDVPKDKGVCTDVVIRSFRKIGIDLQQEVHEDMRAHFSLYPQIWGRSSPDPNIDHRRVPNLMTYFSRKGYTKTITQNKADYHPGDIVAWRLPAGQTHIGIVSREPNDEGTHYLVVHNIGNGQVLEDCLFRFTIIGHYRLPL